MVKIKRNLVWAAIGAAALLAAASSLVGRSVVAAKVDATAVPPPLPPAPSNGVTLTRQQAESVRVVAAAPRDFVAQREAVGFIDFNQDRTTPVFSPWAGRVRQVFVKAGDDVRRGQPLYAIDSPDLVQAESSLIATAGVLNLTAKALERARQMIEVQGNAQKDLEQALSDQQTAEAGFRAARDGVRIFGKSEGEIDKIIAERRTSGELRIDSPTTGRVIARNVAPGVLVQPGTAPAPVTVADLSTMWMVANVTEDDFPLLRPGQEVTVTVPAYPGRKFQAQVANIASAVDPATHRVAVRSEMLDPHHELRAQMLATFVIRTGKAERSVAVPLAGVVREGDGSMSVFVTRDGRRFDRRTVQVGVEQDGMSQITSGLSSGEQVASEGALFLSNALALQTR